MKFGPLEIKLHEDWRQAFKWLQTQLAIAAGGLAFLYGSTDWLQGVLPPKLYAAINGMLALAAIYNTIRKK